MATVTTDGGDAAGKARGMAEDGGRAYAGLDSLLMPPPPARLSDAAAAATATSSYSRSVVPHQRQNDDNTAAATNVTNETMTTPTPDCCRLSEHPPMTTLTKMKTKQKRTCFGQHMPLELEY